MALSDYDNANGNNPGGQGPTAAESNSGGGGRALSKRWSELTQKQKDRFGSKSEFSGAKQNYKSQQNVAANAGGGDAYTSTEKSRMAGEKMKNLNSQLAAAQEAGQEGKVEKLQGRIDRQENRVYGDGTGSIADNYDASAGGAGSGVNKARTSGKDLKELEQRYGKQAVVDYMEGAGKDTMGGAKAQNVLAQYKSELTNSEVDPDTPVEEVVEEIKDQDPGTPSPGPTPTPTPEATNPTPTPAPEATNPTPTQTPETTDDSENEQTEETLSGGGINTGGTDTGDASTGGVSGGTNNTGGNNQQEGQVNQVGAGSVNTGGNEQNTDVTYGSDTATVGNNNSGNVSIDQSERYYGGNQNNMSVVYGEGSSPTNTAAVSDLTMMGMGKADDSPAAQAKFVDMYQDLNAQAQKKYANVGTSTANQYIQNAADTNPIDYVALNQEIGRSIERHYNNSTAQGAMYMGDPYNYRPPTYEMPEPLDPVENNVEETTENAQDNMDDDD